MSVRPLFAAGSVVFLSLVAAACGLDGYASVDGGFERTLGVAGLVTIDVRTASGSIVVRPGPADSVRVVARLRGQNRFGRNVEERLRRIEADPPLEQDGGTIRIGHFEDDDLARDIRISYEITTPADTQLVARAGVGDHRIDDLRRPVDATTGAGRIRMQGIEGDVRAFSGAGDIEVTQVGDANVDVATGAGRIEITGARRALRVRSGAGDVRLDGRPGADWDVETMAGSIRLRVPADSAFELNARTLAGRIEVDQPMTVVESTAGQPGAGMRLRSTIGSGGPRVELASMAGSIHVD